MTVGVARRVNLGAHGRGQAETEQPKPDVAHTPTPVGWPKTPVDDAVRTPGAIVSAPVAEGQPPRAVHQYLVQGQ